MSEDTKPKKTRAIFKRGQRNRQIFDDEMELSLCFYMDTCSKLFHELTSVAVRRLLINTLSKIKFQCPHRVPRIKWLALIGHILS